MQDAFGPEPGLKGGSDRFQVLGAKQIFCYRRLRSKMMRGRTIDWPAPQKV